MSNGRRGRPLGFRLSEESKRAISESKKGQKHKEETKDKISKSLILYFRNKNPLSEELTNMYCRFDADDDICDWMEENSDALDSFCDVLTLKTLRNARRIELSFGPNIEFFSHQLTPEVLILYKEFCEEIDVRPMEYYDELEDE